MSTEHRLFHADNGKFDRRTPNRWLWSHLAAAPLPLGFTVLGELVHTASSVSIALLIGALVDRVLAPGARIGVVDPYVWSIFGFTLLRFLAGLGGAAAGQILSERVQQTAREEAFTELLQKDVAFHTRERSGDLMATVTSDAQMLSVMVLPGMTMLLSAALATAIPLVGIGLLNARLLLVPVLFVGLAFWLIQRYGRALEPLTWRARGQYGALSSVTAEALSGIDVVRTHGLQSEMKRRFLASAGQYRDALVAEAGVEARYLPTLLYALAFAAALAQGLWLRAGGVLTVGQLVAFAGLFIQFQSPAGMPLYGISLVQLGLSCAERILELLCKEAPVIQQGTHAAPLLGELRLTGLTLRMGGRTVLNGVDFRLAPGEHVAVIGATGAGKTGLLQLLSGTLLPDQGEVLFDGVPLEQWALPSLRPQIATVEQEVFLFNRTIGENVRFGAPVPVTDRDVWAALEQAQAAGFVSTLPQGLATLVGERGVHLSGGQRQRLALARAFIRHPAVLLLDDVTSALDEETGQRVAGQLAGREGRPTTVMITNRWSMLGHVDRIVLLENGQLRTFGTLDELIATTSGQPLQAEESVVVPVVGTVIGRPA